MSMHMENLSHKICIKILLLLHFPQFTFMHLINTSTLARYEDLRNFFWSDTLRIFNSLKELLNPNRNETGGVSIPE